MRQFHYFKPNFAILMLAINWFLAAPALLTAQQATTIHVFVAVQNDPNIGSPKDKISMQTFTTMLRDQTGVPVSVKFVDAATASKENIEQMLREANIRSNDAVWYFYSGHGANYDLWPQSAQQKVPLTWVHQKLKDTHARLTLATYDCCSVGRPDDVPLSSIAARILNLKVLFIESKGNIIVASGQSGSLSYGSSVSGGLFTNALLDGIKNNSTWETALTDAQTATERQATRLNYVQKPKFAIENSGLQPAINAPSLEIRQNDTVEKIVESIQEMFDHSTQRKVIVTFDDIIRWNPGLTRANFDSYKGKEIKVDVDDSKLKAGK